jgi:hypothetical protein
MTTSADGPGSETIKAMFPGFGFFGTAWADRLQVDVFSQITDLVVSNPHKGAMDLKAIRVLGSDADDLKPNVVTMTNADGSTSSDEDVDLFQLNPVHAESDEAPYWWVHFPEPVLVRRLLIFNSAAGRNFDLVVTATSADGTTLQLRDPSSIRDLTAVLATIAKYAKYEGLFAAVSNPHDAQAWRNKTVAAVCEAWRAGAPRPSMDEALRMTSLMPMHDGDELTDEDYFFIAYILMAQTARNEASRSGWRVFRNVLPSRTSLKRLESKFGAAAALLGVEPRSLTRHGLVQSSKLKSETAGIGDLAVRLRADLAEQGLTPLIAYGSLLGHVREGHLLDHDDDFDSMVCVAASSRSEFDEKRASVVAELRRQGWEVKLNGKYWNVHVSLPGDPAHIDMFFVHVQNDRAFTHMERMKVRDVPAQWLDPGEVVTVDGIQMAIPREPEKFLEDRYGSGWTVADPYADWPWALSD